MKGNNEIVLNQSTIATAVQYYFDNVLFKEGQSPLVKSVEASNKSTGYGTENNFSVKVEELKAAQV